MWLKKIVSVSRRSAWMRARGISYLRINDETLHGPRDAFPRLDILSVVIYYVK